MFGGRPSLACATAKLPNNGDLGGSLGGRRFIDRYRMAPSTFRGCGLNGQVATKAGHRQAAGSKTLSGMQANVPLSTSIALLVYHRGGCRFILLRVVSGLSTRLPALARWAKTLYSRVDCEVADGNGEMRGPSRSHRFSRKASPGTSLNSKNY